MTNPAVDTTPDGTSEPDVTSEADASFLADFDAQIFGNASSPSEETERSSEPESDAADVPDTADAPDVPDGGYEARDPAPAAEGTEEIAKYEPLAYTVNGQERHADWALQVGDEGVVIPAQHVARFKDLIQRDEWQNAQNRELYQKTQQYEALTHKVGDDEFKGIDAFRQLQAERAALDASGGRVLQALADPEFVTELALAYQNGDQGQVQGVMAKMLEQIQFTGERAKFNALKSLQDQERESTQQHTMSQTQETEYRNIITEFGKALPELTPDDLKAMYEQFGAFRERIFRPATLEEARQFGVRPGTIIKDPTVMHAWAKDRAALRKQYTEATSAAQKAAQENAARQGTPRPTKGAKGTARPAKPSAPAPKNGAMFEGDDGSYAAWQKRLMAGKWAHDDATQDT